MIKKKYPSQEDKKIWEEYIKNPSGIYDKDQSISNNIQRRERYKFDLHGFTLDDANKKVKEIIISCSEKNYKEILLITGKGLHSRDDDVYKSSKLNKLRYSVPEYINSDEFKAEFITLGIRCVSGLCSSPKSPSSSAPAALKYLRHTTSKGNSIDNSFNKFSTANLFLP